MQSRQSFFACISVEEPGVGGSVGRGMLIGKLDLRGTVRLWQAVVCPNLRRTRRRMQGAQVVK